MALVFKSAPNLYFALCLVFQSLNSLNVSSQCTSFLCGCWGGSHLGRKLLCASPFFPSPSRAPNTCDSCASLKFYRWPVLLPVSNFLIKIHSKRGMVVLNLSTLGAETGGLLRVWVGISIITVNKSKSVLKQDSRTDPRFPSHLLSALVTVEDLSLLSSRYAVQPLL